MLPSSAQRVTRTTTARFAIKVSRSSCRCLLSSNVLTVPFSLALSTRSASQLFFGRTGCCAYVLWWRLFPAHFQLFRRSWLDGPRNAVLYMGRASKIEQNNCRQTARAGAETDETGKKSETLSLNAVDVTMAEHLSMPD